MLSAHLRSTVDFVYPSGSDTALLTGCGSKRLRAAHPISARSLDRRARCGPMSRLGHWVLLSARAFRSADLFAGVIPLGVTGYLTSVAMLVAEHRPLAWQAAQR